MKKYDTYKDSGNQWIGQVPEHWTVKRLKYLAQQLQSGGTPTAGNPDFYTDEADGIPWVAIGDMSSKDVVFDTTKHITEAGRLSKNLKVYPIGTLLYSIYATLGKVSELACPAAINQAILAISLHKDYMQSFCKYVLKAQEKFIVSLASSNTQANLNAEKVANFLMPVPPLSEQQAIVEYLDKKTGQIDQSIALLETQKTDLQAYRQALITETVTKGLNSNAPMKDSGIQWIGEIPEGWEMKRLKHFTALLTDGTHQTPTYLEEGVPFLSIKDISTGKIDFSDVKYISEEEHLALQAHAPVEKGDIIFTRIGTLGVFLKVDTDIVFDIFVSVGLIKLIPNSVNADYLVYYLSSNMIQEYISFTKVGEGTSAPKINLTNAKNMPIITPPLSEQQAIVEYLDKKTSDIDTAIQKINTQIADLQAYRTALNSEAVTGKIDVRNQ